jgi:hypothetical protein
MDKTNWYKANIQNHHLLIARGNKINFKELLSLPGAHIYPIRHGASYTRPESIENSGTENLWGYALCKGILKIVEENRIILNDLDRNELLKVTAVGKPINLAKHWESL